MDTATQGRGANGVLPAHYDQLGNRQRRGRGRRQMVALLALCIAAAFFCGIAAGTHFVYTTKGSGDDWLQHQRQHLAQMGGNIGKVAMDLANGNDEPQHGSLQQWQHLQLHQDAQLPAGSLGSAAFPAVAGSLQAAAEAAAVMPLGEMHSLQAGRGEGGLHAVLAQSLDDQVQVTSMCWVYIKSTSAGRMRTIMSNKFAGCKDDVRGYSLSVQASGMLAMEWAETRQGADAAAGAASCIEETSFSKVPLDQWVHVAVSFSATHVIVHLDGDPVIEKTAMRLSRSGVPMHLGASPGGAHCLDGFLSQALFFSSALSRGDILHLMADTKHEGVNAMLGGGAEMARNIPGWESLLAALPLTDAPAAAAGAQGSLTVFTKGSDRSAELTAKLVLATSGVQLPRIPIVTVRPAADGPSAAGKQIQQLAPGVEERYIDGSWTFSMTEKERAAGERVAAKRAQQVKAAMQFVWGNYKTMAWGKDELKPASGTGQDNWGGLGVTLVDALDTLWLMGLKNEFAEATTWVRDSLTFANAGSVSVFETTIRELGGLLSAYDLSGEKVFLEKAQDLGDRLMPAFDTPSGLPVNNVDITTKTQRGPLPAGVLIAEVGTLQVEFRYLSHATGNPIYASAVNKAMDLMTKLQPPEGIFPISLSPTNGHSRLSTYTIGAMGDSFYEYLLKVWLQGGKSEDAYRHAYDAAVDGMVTHLAKKTEPSGLLYFSDWDGTRNKLKMDHLACFMAGSLGLGAATSQDKERAERDMKLGKALAYTCHLMYKLQPTGLSPEYIEASTQLRRGVPDEDMRAGTLVHLISGQLCACRVMLRHLNVGLLQAAEASVLLLLQHSNS
eukprot:TRINITY_DN268_c0_g1_i5.p1 TRINITY_DN268_c0_g1~~TRINITY_DN268_c0_g1_i5.p1  ORF type:complete len:838 (-),score=164.59 TRINITY_DN268_c0_g1_i5:520-3033(-)